MGQHAPKTLISHSKPPYLRPLKSTLRVVHSKVAYKCFDTPGLSPLQTSALHCIALHYDITLRYTSLQRITTHDITFLGPQGT